MKQIFENVKLLKFWFKGYDIQLVEYKNHYVNKKPL